jgi:hypothetical protein
MKHFLEERYEQISQTNRLGGFPFTGRSLRSSSLKVSRFSVEMFICCRRFKCNRLVLRNDKTYIIKYAHHREVSRLVTYLQCTVRLLRRVKFLWQTSQAKRFLRDLKVSSDSLSIMLVGN